eukprot:CAMPEP_0177667436 /NCGR_PEP_ID=MMETSP0447-20121125/22123_1 /TAXON_ID=0 /ORGANISM="Stygamoeba regulata, Strain BSH-02190019" /LENGTH=132 /DNA_ID=CAMNT_0019173669 /DNA_START=36 /DNA_END=434 /DNA_ORIENTATION=+
MTEKAVSVPPVQQRRSLIGGQATEFVISHYSDRLFVLVTQTGKLSTLLHAVPDRTDTEALENFSVTPLLGDRDCLKLQLIARQVVQHICQFSTKPLLLGLGLSSKPTLDQVKQLIAVLKEMLTPVGRTQPSR